MLHHFHFTTIHLCRHPLLVYDIFSAVPPRIPIQIYTQRWGLRRREAGISITEKFRLRVGGCVNRSTAPSAKYVTYHPPAGCDEVGKVMDCLDQFPHSSSCCKQLNSHLMDPLERGKVRAVEVNPPKPNLIPPDPVSDIHYFLAG